MAEKSPACSAPARGAVAALTAGLLFAVSAASAQALEGAPGDWELNVARFLVQTAVGAAVLVLAWTPPRVEPRLLGWLLLAGLVTCGANYAFYASAPLLALSLMIGLFYSLQCLLGAVNDLVTYRTTSLSTLTGLVFCTIGLVFNIQPWLLGFPPPHFGAGYYGNRSHVCGSRHYQTALLDHADGDNSSLLGPEYTTGEHWPGLSEQSRGYILLVAGSVLSFLAVLIVQCRLHEVPSSSVVFWVGVFSSLTSLLPMFLLEQPRLPSSPACWGTVSLHCWSLAVAVVLLHYSARRTEYWVMYASLVLQIVVLIVLQYTALKHVQPGRRNGQEVLGNCLIVVGNILRPVLDWWRCEDHREDSGGQARYTRIKQ